jgi:hypothetical protein
MAIPVERESITTKARFVSPTYTDKDGVQQTIGSDRPAPIIEVNHLRLHEARAYYVYKMYPYSAGLAAGSSIDIALAFPAGTTPHLIFQYESVGESEFYMYESPTTSGGTALTKHRRNRNVATTSVAAAVLAPTVTSVGTEIYSEFIPASNKGGGGGSYSFEFVLTPLTTYLFRLRNVNSQSHACNLRLEWYE